MILWIWSKTFRSLIQQNIYSIISLLMDKYAIIQLNGKQIMVTEGLTFEIDRQSDLVPEVLLFSDGNNVILGEPVLADVVVKLAHVSDKMGDKVVVARYKSKSRYRKKKGHRQPLTVVKVESISNSKKGTESKPESSEKKKPAAKVAKPKATTAPTKAKAKKA